MDIPNDRLRRFFKDHFSQVEIDSFCYDYFPDVYDDFSSQMSKDAKITELLSYVHRHRKHSKLFRELSKARPQMYEDLQRELRKDTKINATVYSDLFTLGNRSFPFQVIDGDGVLTYTPSTITCAIDPSPLELPPDVEALRAEVMMEEEAKKKAGEHFHWNGPQLALKRYRIGRTVPDEKMELHLVLQNTDYYTFRATVLSLDRPLKDGKTLREKYLNPAPEDPIPFLAIGLGVAFVLFTSDEKLILSRRSSHASARPGELDISFVEGIHAQLDRTSDGTCPNVYSSAIRGAEEEVGIDLQPPDFHLLGFGVDHDYYQWNLIGMANLPMTSQEALRRRTRGASGKWEVRDFPIIDARPDAVWEFIAKEKLWAMGWAALYWSLVYKYGRDVVDKSAEDFFK